MNNENNNNGTVLGSVNNSEIPNQMQPNNVESLGTTLNENPTIGSISNEGMPNPLLNDPNVNVPNSVNPTPVAPEIMNNQPTLQSNPGQVSQPSVDPTMASPVSPQNIQPNPINNIPNSQQEPMPAYTNPQTINQNMGFESSNVVGTNPPMSFEQEKKPKKKSNNKLVFFVILILLVLAGVGFGTYYVLNYTNILNKNSANVNIKTKDHEIDLGSEISTNINDYATITGTNAQNCSLNLENVNSNEEGVYEFIVTCGEMHKSGKITVVDNSEINVNLKEVYKAKGETLEASEFSNESDVELEFVDSTEVEKYLSSDPGTYTVKLKATKDNETKEIEGKITILEYPLKGFYTCTGKEQSVSDSKAMMSVGDMFAIVNGENVVNGYGKVAYEVHVFNFKDALDEFNELVKKYNQEGTLTINNVTGNVIIDEVNKIITIKSKNLTNEEVIKKYGEDNIKDYASIRDYFNKLNGSQTDETYTCKYEKSN